MLGFDAQPHRKYAAGKLGCYEAKMLLSAYSFQLPSNPCTTLGPLTLVSLFIPLPLF